MTNKGFIVEFIGVLCMRSLWVSFETFENRSRTIGESSNNLPNWGLRQKNFQHCKRFTRMCLRASSNIYVTDTPLNAFIYRLVLRRRSIRMTLRTSRKTLWRVSSENHINSPLLLRKINFIIRLILWCWLWEHASPLVNYYFSVAPSASQVKSNLLRCKVYFSLHCILYDFMDSHKFREGESWDGGRAKNRYS
jgi:hypothetical protein